MSADLCGVTFSLGSSRSRLFCLRFTRSYIYNKYSASACTIRDHYCASKPYGLLFQPFPVKVSEHSFRRFQLVTLLSARLRVVVRKYAGRKVIPQFHMKWIIKLSFVLKYLSFSFLNSFSYLSEQKSHSRRPFACFPSLP